MDFMYFIQLEGNDRLIVGFCHSKSDDESKGKEKILATFKERKENISSLTYVGELNYSEADIEVNHYLNKFEKYDDVWLLI